MNLMRWNPFQEMEDLFKSYNRALAHTNSGGITRADWAPTVDITEGEKEFVIKAELPGIKKEEIKIDVHNGLLTLSGERKSETKDEKQHRVERFYGSFVRSFSLPENVREDAISAEHIDGVLHVHLPKVEQPKPKAINVKVK